MPKLTRRELLKLVGGASAAGILVACSDNAAPIDAPKPDAPKGCVVTDASVMIKNNHTHAPHELIVSSADVQAGVEKIYDIRGAANHTHLVTVTADQFAMLKAGGTVMSTSTTEVDHEHLCTISCG